MNKLQITNFKDFKTKFPDFSPEIVELFAKMPFDLQIAVSAGCEYVVERKEKQIAICTKNPIHIKVLPKMVIVNEKIGDTIKTYSLKVELSQNIKNNLKKHANNYKNN